MAEDLATAEEPNGFRHDRVEIERRSAQVVPGAFDELKLVPSGYQSQSFAHFCGRAEGVFGSAHKKRRGAQVGEMRGARLIGFIRHVKRIRKQQQRVGKTEFFRCQHAGLPAAVGMASQHDRPVNGGTKKRRRRAQSGAIFRGCIASRRSARFPLPERQIAPQYRESVRGECLCDSN
jgi:hypothetical protein